MTYSTYVQHAHRNDTLADGQISPCMAIGYLFKPWVVSRGICPCPCLPTLLDSRRFWSLVRPVSHAGLDQSEMAVSTGRWAYRDNEHCLASDGNSEIYQEIFYSTLKETGDGSCFMHYQRGIGA